MASIVTRSYACDVEVCGKGRKKKDVQIETNKNKIQRQGKEEGMKDRKRKKMAQTRKVTGKEKNE